jgi:hypothetical protein
VSPGPGRGLSLGVGPEGVLIFSLHAFPSASKVMLVGQTVTGESAAPAREVTAVRRQPMKRRILVIAALALLLIAAGLAAVCVDWDDRSEQLAAMFGGEDALETVRHPLRVEAYRLGRPPAEIDNREADPSDYPVVAGPVQLPKSLAEESSRALLSQGTYGWIGVKGCGPPVYGAQMTFLRGPDRIDVFFCFSCNFLLVRRNGRITGGEDFDDSRAVFVRAVKAAFPTDEVIQGLLEGRG